MRTLRAVLVIPSLFALTYEGFGNLQVALFVAFGGFANLIVAQRAFEANSKTVTTFDTVTQETIDMIR